MGYLSDLLDKIKIQMGISGPASQSVTLTITVSHGDFRRAQEELQRLQFIARLNDGG